MEPVLTQVESVMSKKYHEGFQSTLWMIIPVGGLPKWVSNDMDIHDKEIETAYTKFTEAISVNTAGKMNFLCLLSNMIHSIGKLEKAFSEMKTDKTMKKPSHKNKTRHPKKSGGNAHVRNEDGCDADGDEEDADGQSWVQLMDGGPWIAMATYSD
jgi:hypothetical protein